MLIISDNGRAMLALPTERATAAALGVFDGVHRGHRAVIGRAREYAEKNGLAAAVCTFKTDTISTKGTDFLPIFTEEKKLSLLSGEGVEYIYDPDFSHVRDMSAEVFVRDILAKKLRAASVVCGNDFRLGKNAACGVHELENICRDFGIAVIPVDDITEQGEKISSARLRQMIKNGDISGANRLLGSCYSIDGEVICGNRFGRQMNFPTANQALPRGVVCPMYGVYASRAVIDGRTVKGITNIGIKPTVSDEGMPLSETHFIGFEGDIYGRDISVELLRFIRPEKKFDSPGELQRQIGRDIAEAEKIT